MHRAARVFRLSHLVALGISVAAIPENRLDMYTDVFTSNPDG